MITRVFRATAISLYIMILSVGFSAARQQTNLVIRWLQQEQESHPAARKFDEFDIGDSFAFGDMKARLDYFCIDGLLKEPSSKAYVIFYRGRRRSSRYYPLQIRTYLSKTRGVPNKVETIYGGYRENPTMELWIVPQGAANPKPTPTFYPKKRRKR